MEIEVRYRDPARRTHRSVVRTGVKQLTPERINQMVFKAGRQLIYTPGCPYSGTEISAKDFRIRSVNTTTEYYGDFFWTKRDDFGDWSKWHDYDKFYDECFPVETETYVKTVVIKTLPRRRS